MLKSIKVSQEVYGALESIAEKRETFGECIMRLIKAYRKLREIQFGEKPDGGG